MKQPNILNSIERIFITLILMLIGLYLFKWYPMSLHGEILWDASAHIVFTSLILYILHFFIGKKKIVNILYAMLCVVVLITVSIQRIEVHAHNYIGLLKGFLIAGISIVIPRLK